ncbi:MAG: glycosyltransferase family 2 protein [Candidatus Magasanikbacteria bacterium]|nr:glycosyltransferase family 2 protein [Candidatus Magasanikbacteria bacterium]
MARLTVNLVAWNGSKYVPYLFESLRRQIFRDWFLRVLDNGSVDNAVSLIKKELTDFPMNFEVIEGKENLGFAGGHNLLYQKTKSEFFLLLNQDICLEPDVFEKLAAFMASHPEAAAVSSRLMKWDFSRIGEGLEKSFSSKIDSLGLRVFRNRRVIERNAGEDWNNDKAGAVEVFGVSGALPLFRKSAMETAAFADGTLFDSSYHSYKEDVDLAYRLRAAGFKSFVLLDAVAYHDRSATGAGGNLSVAKNKRRQSFFVKYASYKNHLATLYKNEYGVNLLLDFPFILWYEIGKLLYFVLFERKVLKGWVELWRRRKNLRDKRQEIIAKRKLTWPEMRRQIFL